MSKIRHRKRISGVILAVLLAALLAGCGDEAAGSGVLSQAVLTEEPPVRLALTEEASRKGDLILVSADHAYDFDANSDKSLSLIREAQTYDYPVDNEEFRLATRIMGSLDQMIWDCDEAMGSTYTSISSAYRSKEYQQGVWDEYEELYGEDYVRQYVARPGFSEHHTGLALDLGITYEDGSPGTFSESENAKWMAENSYHYGFVRRYAEDKTEITGISNEAWHFRYVGQPHAAYMHEHNLCLEEYLELLQSDTSPDEPLLTEADGTWYAVWYTAGREMDEPEGPYRISGDNMGGYIVTMERS